MDENITTFMSYNSTGFSTLKTKWLRDLINVTNADFISIQEHFKKTKSIEEYFANEFPHHSSFIVPGHREPGNDSGRPKGGLAMLSSKQKKVNKVRVKTSHFRIQAQVLTFPKTRLLWINTYMPTDPQTFLYDDTELMEVLNEVENILKTEDFDDVIWIGDMNWDRKRVTGFCEVMENFVRKLGLVDVWDKFAVTYTHIHTDLKSVSTIDRILVNERLLPFILDAGVMHLADNPSRHSPILLKINAGNLPKSIQTTLKKSKCPAWFKASSADMNNYTSSLDARLHELEPPASLYCRDPNCHDKNHSLERDRYVLDVLSALIETTQYTIPMTQGGGSSNRFANGTLPGWQTEVEPLREDSLFWHSVWQSAGRPTTGILHLLMARTRNRYHYAVRRVKKHAEQIKAENLLYASLESETKLLAEMKRLNKGKSKIGLSEIVDGADNPEDIVQKFKAVYSNLYNSAPTDIEHLLEGLEINKESVNEVNLVTGNIIKQAVCKLKPNKQDVSGSYSSDAILHGPDSLFEILASIIQSFLIHGTVTRSLLACAFIPLLKPLKDPSQTDSYRAIASSSLILKLLDNVIILLWGHLLSSDSLQFGFKPMVSTTTCTWLVSEVTSHYIRSGTPVITTLLDCSKAFDKCKFVPLFEKLLDRNLPTIVVRMLIFIYTQQEAWVKWGDVSSEGFRISNGTRQGSVFSPCLFSIYLDDLLKELRQCGLGCHMGGLWIGAVAFADDLLLMAPNRSAMAKMLKICEDYGTKFNLQFSTDVDPSKSKSKSIFMTGQKVRKVQKPVPLKLYDKDLPWVSHASHLGHELHENGDQGFDCRMKRASFIENSVQIRETFKFAYPAQILKAVQINCCDFYGSMLWNLFDKNAVQFYNSWSTCVKLVWGIPRTTHRFFVMPLSGSIPSIRIQILGRYMKFYQSLLTSRSKEVAVVSRLVGRDAQTVTGLNLLNIQLETKQTQYAESHRVKKVLYEKYFENNSDEQWKIFLLLKYLRLRDEIQSSGDEASFIDDLIYSLCSS